MKLVAVVPVLLVACSCAGGSEHRLASTFDESKAAVRRGELIDLAFNDDVYVYGRKLESEIIIIGINRAAEAKALTAPAAYLELADGARGVPLLGAKEPFTVSAGTLSLTLPPRTAVAYKVAKE